MIQILIGIKIYPRKCHIDDKKDDKSSDMGSNGQGKYIPKIGPQTNMSKGYDGG